MPAAHPPFERGQILVEFCDAPTVPRVLHWNDEIVWIGDVSFALPHQVPDKEDTTDSSPTKPHARYARAPWCVSRAELESKISQGLVMCTALEEPEHWRRLAGGHSTGENAPAALHLRREYDKWLEIQKRRYELIAPLISEYQADFGRILDHRLHQTWPILRAKELGLATPRPVYDALHRVLIGLGMHALMPAYQYRGRPGAPRYLGECRQDADSPPARFPASRAYHTTETCRIKLVSGYRKYVKARVPLRVAYLRTLNDGWSKSKEYLPDGEVKVVLEDKVPSMDQFVRYGKAGSDKSTRREREANRVGARSPAVVRAPNLIASGPRIGVTSQIDSTPCDQIAVSEANRHKLLSVPVMTRVDETQINYTYGMYLGFEAPCALTALLAIWHAVQDKRVICASLGIKLKSPDDWISMCGSTVIGDWGEPSAKQFQVAVDDIEGSIIYAPSYFPEGKAVAESTHHSIHAQHNHLQPGSTGGKRPQRGQRDPAKDACRPFFDIKRDLVEAILYRNNEEYYPPAFLEMVRDGVAPTRKDQILWCKSKGYVGSSLTAIESLRIRCLPKLTASVGIDGLRIFDPSEPNRKRLLDLVFYSRELAETGFFAARHTRYCDVRFDPSTVAHIWVDGRSLVRVPLSTRDPLMRRLSWLDVIEISRDKKLAQFFYRERMASREASRVATIDNRAKQARRIKAAQTPSDSASSSRTGRKQNLNEEMGYEPPVEQVVLSDVKTGRPRLYVVGPQPQDPWDSVMTSIRSAR